VHVIFIIQVYVLYPFLFTGYSKYGYTPPYLSILSFTSGRVAYIKPYLISQGMNINYMVFGHLPAVCLGIVLAVQKSIKIPFEYTLLALLLFIWGNFNQYMWMVADVLFTILFPAVTIIVFKIPAQCIFIAGLLFLRQYLVPIGYG